MVERGTGPHRSGSIIRNRDHAARALARESSEKRLTIEIKKAPAIWQGQVVIVYIYIIR